MNRSIQVPFLHKGIRKEDLWIVPFTGMAVVLAGYTATAHKASVWLVSGLLILGMLIFSGVLIARKYSKARSLLHLIMGACLIIAAVVVTLAIKQIA